MSDVAVVDTLRVINFSAISGSYVEITPAFEHIVRIICFTNNTDGDMLLSFDLGVSDNLIVPAGSGKVFDLTTNRADNNTSWTFAKGTRIFIKQSTAPTSGDFYIECLYQRGQ